MEQQPIYVVRHHHNAYDADVPAVFVFLNATKAWTKYHGLVMTLPRHPLEQGHEVSICAIYEDDASGGDIYARDRKHLACYSPDTLASEHTTIQERHEAKARYAKKKGKPYSYLQVDRYSYHNDKNS